MLEVAVHQNNPIPAGVTHPGADGGRVTEITCQRNEPDTPIGRCNSLDFR